MKIVRIYEGQPARGPARRAPGILASWQLPPGQLSAATTFRINWNREACLGARPFPLTGY